MNGRGPGLSAVTRSRAASLWEALDRAGVRWCALREPGAYPWGYEDDLVVAPRDLRALVGVLQAQGYVRLPAWGHGPHRFFLTYDEQDGTWHKVDVVTALRFGPGYGIALGSAQRVVARGARHGPRRRPDPDDAFWCLLAHCLLDKGTLRPDHVAALGALAAHADPANEIARDLSPLLPPGWTAGMLVDAVGDRRIDALEALGADSLRRWRTRHPLRAATRTHGARALRRARRVGLPPRAGLTLALLAPDGAGKSSLATSLASAPVPVSVVYMGLYGHERSQGRRHRSPGLGLLVHLGRQWARCARGWWLAATGSIVVFDRYAYDALVAARPGEGRLRRWRRAILGASCPEPDLVVILDAPGDLLHARRREHDPATLEDRRQRYLALRRPDWLVVDASGDADEVRREVSAEVWRRYAAAASRDAPR